MSDQVVALTEGREEDAAYSLRSLRQKSGLKLDQLAVRAAVSATDLRKWERGLARPDHESIERIAAVLGVDAASLYSLPSVPTTTAGEGYVTSIPGGTQVFDRQLPVDSDKKLVVDLFCGAGGFSFGFESTGVYQVSCGLDLLPDRIGTFRKNHLHAISIAGDISQFPIDALQAFSVRADVVIGGPPCQGFSSIRPFRVLTQSDKRNNLPEAFLFAVSTLRPRWFVLENVVGLLSHQNGTFFEELITRFIEVGYKVDWRVINAANFGLPQNRERVFIVGNTLGRSFRWPKPTHYVSAYRSMAGRRAKLLLPDPPLFGGFLKPALAAIDAISDLPPLEAGRAASQYGRDPINPYQRKLRGHAEPLTLHEATDHSEKMMKIIRAAGKNRNALPEGITTSGFSSCYSRLDADVPSVTLTVNFIHPSSNKCIHPFQDRALTPREGARLQGFPDYFKFNGSRAQIVKQIGNAVPPLMGEVLAAAISEQD